jgi:hypothetical protein
LWRPVGAGIVFVQLFDYYDAVFLLLWAYHLLLLLLLLLLTQSVLFLDFFFNYVGLNAGQAVANVRLASLDPVLRNEIRRSAEALIIMEQQVSYQNLVYELERIYTYLAMELGNPTTKGYIPLQDRLNVAEYGLLESQIENCSKELNSKGVVDADILAVIAEQMTDFKRRLGIDYYVTGLTYDREAIGRWLNDLYIQSMNGVMFYVKGTRLFWNDVLYCASLIGRAVQGDTLKPREVRMIRYVF